MTASKRSLGGALRAMLKFCASIPVGIALMTILAVVMGWATFLERDMGTPVAQYLVYASPTFYLLVAALACNLACAAIVRVPKLFVKIDGKRRVNKALLPFFIAHCGVILLIFGCLVTATRSSKARATIPEGTAVEKAIDVDSRLLKIQVVDFGANQNQENAVDVEIPFAGGPLNWRDQESSALWRADVAEPILATKSDATFFGKLGKKAATWSQRGAYLAAKLAKRPKRGTLFDADGLKIEALEYATLADYAPVPDLQADLTIRKPDGKTESRPFSLAFPFEGAVVGGDPLATTRKSQRATLDDGLRVVYAIADSDAEARAFARAIPQTESSDRVVLVLDGEPFELELDDLKLLAQYGDLENQRISLTTRRDEIARRLRQELDYVENAPEPEEQQPEEQQPEEQQPEEQQPEEQQPEEQQPEEQQPEEQQPEEQQPEEQQPSDVGATPSVSAPRYAQEAETTESKASKLKPLQTTTRDDLLATSAKLRELSDALARAADAATDPKARAFEGLEEYKAALREFERQRVLYYLATTWSQLESASESSQTLIETLERMLDETARRADEVEQLALRTMLGASGWRVVSFVMTATQFQGVEELAGWTATLTLESPEGASVQTTLFSELAERNRYSDSGRVFGAIWLAEPGGGDTTSGRKWLENLDKPKLELMQSRGGELYYRVSGRGVFAAGKLDLSPVDETKETFGAAPVEAPCSDSPADADQFASFAVRSFAFQDELGARLLPTLFAKNGANEFYGRLKVRATLDETTETFWLRTIPLESVEPTQIDMMTKTIASKRRRAQIRLTDREIELGAALFVKRFTPAYEPGSSTPASFACVARVLPKGLSRDEQIEAVATNPEKDVVIEMNRPGTLKASSASGVYWVYQDSFRGPYKPGDKQFDDVVQGKLLPGEETPRDSIYYTVVSFNDDPGRGLKYLACLLIVWGTALLVYRGRPRKAERAAAPTAHKIDAARARSGRATFPTVAALCVVALVLCAARALRADVKQETPLPKADAAIDWSAWRSLPVFDGGRRMPLNAFARILVDETTGDAAPTIVAPPSVAERLEGDKPLNFPELDEFLDDVAAEKGAKDDEDARARRKQWYDEVAAKTVARQRDAARRVSAAFRDGKRKFSAPELLFSWLAEPELWEYVPFILDEKSVVAREVLKMTEDEIVAKGGRLAPADFDVLTHGTDKTRVEVYRASASADPEVLRALDRVEDRLANWRSVVFVPTQGGSTLPRSYFNKALFGDARSVMSGMRASPVSRLDDAASRLERLLKREKRALRKTSPLNDKEHLLRQRVKLANNDSREALALARRVAALAEIYRRYPLSSSGILFEKALDSTSGTLEELRAHRDLIVSEQTFSLEYREALMEAVSALDEIVGLLEQASLALTTEEPKALRLVPVVSERVFRVAESQDSPWVSLQTLLWAPDPLYARFVDPRESNAVPEERTLPEDAETISPFDDMAEALRKTRANQSTSRPAADAFLEAVDAYRDYGAADRAERVAAALERFAAETRALAERDEPIREALARETSGDDKAIAAYFSKTRYPDQGALDAELFYDDLDAFFWNWIACLTATIAFLLSYLRQGIDKASGRANARSERFFFTLGLVALIAGCVVAFLGCAARAVVTGWAPVSNMFETVVLLALLIATIAVGYALAPIWARPYRAAWRATSFSSRAVAPEYRKVRRVVAPIRAILTVAALIAGVALWLRSRGAGFDEGAFEAIRNQIVAAVTMQGFLDAFVALAAFLFVATVVPRFLATILALLVFPRTIARLNRPATPPDGGTFEEIARRRAFLAASAFVAALVAGAAYFNSSEFNPNIRPLVAVLRSNFWLTIHVLAIIVSYALGAIAWIVSLTSLAHYIFGKYPRDPNVCDPEYSSRVAPTIAALMRGAALFLTVGIILGARWADFSWGRFWSWDPKEVWALVTLLVYLVVLHALRLSGRGRFVLALGATLGALAIIMTWYGLSFAMGGGGRHAYSGGESNKVAALCLLFAANILWAIAAIARYCVEKTRRRARRALDVDRK